MRREGKADGLKPEMDGCEKSHRPKVPKRPQNKGNGPQGKGPADGEEGRGLTKGNTERRNARRTQGRASVGNELDRVRQAAGRDKKGKLTALLHHVTKDRLEAAYRRLNREAAAGVDDVTWKQYGEGLAEKIADLHERLHKGAYRAKPTKRAYIPKADGRQRPLGIASLEDKIVQGAVVEVLNAVLEADFLGFSYGSRPGRSAHDALAALVSGIVRKKVGWVLDADIRDFFGTINREWLIRFVEHRIGDRRIVRLIRQWLAAGVMERGEVTWDEEGTPQGATISPLLANLYLHYVLDVWVHHWRRTRARGEVIIVRYVDDYVIGLEHRWEAEQLLKELRERMRKFGLELHPEKTRLLEFGRFAEHRRKRRGEGKPETFTFLGFRHVCGTSKAGWFVVKRLTDTRRMRAKLKAVKVELKRKRHLPIPQQGSWLRSVVRGYYNYHAVPLNYRALASFREGVGRLWTQALRRRSQRTSLTWNRMKQRIDRWIPRPRILHPWPTQQFDVKHPR